MKFVPNFLSQRVGRQILVAQKHAPRALFVGGIFGILSSTVLACRATMKLEKTLGQMEYDVMASKIATYPTQSDRNKDLVRVYLKNTLRLAKLYGPAAVVGGVSIAALTGSHVTLSRRNVGLTAAYSAVSMSFDEYRKRVRDQLGEKAELDVYHASKKEVVTREGKTKEIRTSDPTKWSPYARWFEESNDNWTKSAEQNFIFIKMTQEYLNHILRVRGHVFLNEAYDALGLERSKEGAIVGWVFDKSDNTKGDNFIDFGLYESTSMQFLQGWERNVILDFNVDGVIYDLI